MIDYILKGIEGAVIRIAIIALIIGVVIGGLFAALIVYLVK